MARKVVIVGLDGGTWNIFAPMIEAGYMPTVKGLMEKGYSGKLRSTIPPVTAPAWATFQTGLNPGKHGIFDFVKYDRKTHGTVLVNSTFLKEETMWEKLARAGKKVVTVNVPMTYPVRRTEGWTVVGDLMAGEIDERFCHPESLAKELQAMDYRIGVRSMDEKFTMSLTEFIDETIEVETKRMDLAKMLYEREQPDVLMVHNQSLDVIQHGYFQHVYPGSEVYRKEAFDEMGRFLRNTDDGIDSLLQMIDPATDIYVVSDHGFNMLRKAVLLNNYLNQLGLLKYRRKAIVKDIMRIVKRFDVLRLRKFLSAKLAMANCLSLFSSITTGMLNWDKTTCYMPSGNIYGNLIFRERPSDSKMQEIMGRMRELTDGGKPVVRNVWQAGELYDGDFLDRFPDVIIEPEVGYSFQTTLMRGGTRDVFYNMNYKFDVGGTHERDGIMVLAADGGQVEHKEGAHHDIADICPTILTRMGIAVAAETDGRILSEAYADELKGEFVEESSGGSGVDEESIDSEAVIERLKGLGYI